MNDILNDGIEEKHIEYWNRVREDIGKFDNIIVNNYIQHMTILAGLITLSAYLFLGNSELCFFSASINFIVAVLAISFKGQNHLYQTLSEIISNLQIK